MSECKLLNDYQKLELAASVFDCAKMTSTVRNTCDASDDCCYVARVRHEVKFNQHKLLELDSKLTMPPNF